MNPAPPKPPSKTADRKALAAYYSELRRWARSLAQWEADLDEREATFEDYEEDCGCTPEDAAKGCECPTCEDYRVSLLEKKHELLEEFRDKKAAGEDVKWLEDLWNLEDKRK